MTSKWKKLYFLHENGSIGGFIGMPIKTRKWVICWKILVLYYDMKKDLTLWFRWHALITQEGRVSCLNLESTEKKLSNCISVGRKTNLLWKLVLSLQKQKREKYLSALKSKSTFYFSTWNCTFRQFLYPNNLFWLFFTIYQAQSH